MKRLCIVLLALTIPLQLGARAQAPPPLLAYDFCARSGIDPSMIGCEVHIVDRDSNSITVLPSEGVGMPGVAPAWSPDGLRLAAGGEYLRVYNLADGATTYLESWVGPPSWSPDNTRIGFLSNRDGQAELYVINDDGSALTRLTDNVGFRGWFAWSPDGTAIAYAATIGGVPELFVMQTDGSNKRRLTYNVGFDTHTVFQVAASASWSPDGSRIAFDCANNICAINQDGTGFTQLTTDPIAAYGPVFSPVDGRIAFATGRFGLPELAILEVNGAVTRVAPGIWAGQQTWSAGGDRLAFVALAAGGGFCDTACYYEQGERVFAVNSDGTSLQNFGNGHHPRWAPAPAPTGPGQPVATIVSNCTGTSCQFDATNSFDPDGSIASYQWAFGDGTTATGATAAHQYAIGNHYNVTLIVTDNSGTNGTTFRTITANSPPVAAATATCTGARCTLSASASSDPDGWILYYQWDFVGGTIIGTISHQAAFTFEYPTGTLVAKLTVWDNAYFAAETTVTFSVVNPFPVASFTFACVALTCTFDPSASSDPDSPIHGYAWDFGDGATSGSPFPTHTYAAAGAYPTKLTVTDFMGQKTAISQTVNVTAPPPPPPSVLMHVGDLDGSATSQQKTWTATATIGIHRGDHQPLSGVAVFGNWSDGGTGGCTTDAAGRCAMLRGGIPNKINTLTLTVTSAVRATFTYSPAANHDPESDSNGTAVTVRKR